MKGGEKMKRLVGILLILVLVFSFFLGCSKSEESGRSTSAERTDAALMSLGLSMMTGNIGEYDDYVGEAAKGRGDPPPPWQGPAPFNTPDGNTFHWYWYDMVIHDTAGVDTMLFLIMLDPDLWEDSMVTFVNKVEIWLMYTIEETIWFNFALEMEAGDSHLSGFWQWHYQDTWLKYEFTDMATEYGDYSGIVDITTSNNIRLAAHFEFNVDGSGTGSGTFQGIEFVRYTFYTMPPEPYRGHYTLASEGWNVEHTF
jgi:hypothetical protein